MRYALAISLVIELVACESPTAVPDAVVADTPMDAPCMSPPLGTGMLTGLCVHTAAPFMWIGRIDTTTDPRCVVITQPNGPDLCMIEASDIAVVGDSISGQRPSARGIRPLVLLASNVIDVRQEINVRSDAATDGLPGPGARLDCASDAGAADAGGGAGGTFGFSGGAGGEGNGSMMPVAGGAPRPVAPLTGVYGGCSGGGAAHSTYGGGPGGGAIYMIAATAIFVQPNVRINASGQPGMGVGSVASGVAGGGGGGSGGFIALDAPMIVNDGDVFARGAGGGAGGAPFGGSVGVGTNGGTVYDGTSPATGGRGFYDDSNGGAGCGAPAGEAGADAPAQAAYGAGGGGGGCGIIRIYGSYSGTGTLNPLPT